MTGTFLAGYDVPLQLQAETVELVSMPVFQEHLVDSHLKGGREMLISVETQRSPAKDQGRSAPSTDEVVAWSWH